MEKKTLVYSPNMIGDLDDDYTLYDNGEVLHFYDRNRYPGGYNLKETLKASELKVSIKERLLKASKEEDRELVKKLLGLE